MSRSEDAVVNEALRWIEEHEKPSHARKIHGNRYMAGHPDIEACIDGQHVLIECKAPGEEARPRQKACLRKWRDAGSIAIVWDGETELDNKIDV